MKRPVIFLFGIVAFFLMMAALVPQAAQAAPLVTCGGSGQAPCHLCDLVKGVSGLINYMRTVMVYIALTVITAMGVVYIVSAGNDGMMSMAKNGIKFSLTGIVIILSAWLIVNTLMFTVFGAKDGLGVTASFGTTTGFQFDCSASL